MLSDTGATSLMTAYSSDLLSSSSYPDPRRVMFGEGPLHAVVSYWFPQHFYSFQIFNTHTSNKGDVMRH